MILELKDIVTTLISLISAAGGSYFTVKFQETMTSKQEKKREEEQKKVIEDLMNIIWKDKIKVLYKPLLRIEKQYLEIECSNILIGISEHDPERIPSLIGDETFQFLKFQYRGDSYYNLTKELKNDNLKLGKLKSDYKNAVMKSIAELKDLKEDIRSQYHNNFIEVLMSLQKMIITLKTKFLPYANKKFVSEYIYDCVGSYVEISDSYGEIIDVPEIFPDPKNYLELSNSKNQILEKVEQKIMQDTLFNKVIWENEIRVNK